MPPVTGIMLNAVEEKKRAQANSIANLWYNLFGYLPAPMFYGFVAWIVKNPESRTPMSALLYSTIFSVSFMIYGVHSKMKKDKKA